MKLISARASRAPAPHQHREARAGHLASRARSRGCRARRRGPSAASARSRTRAARRARRTSTLSSALLPDRHARVRQVRQRQQQPRRAAARSRRAAISSCLICCAARLVGREQRRRVLALPLGARDLVAGGVLLALQALDLGISAAALGFERRELARASASGSSPRLRRRGADLVDVVAHEMRDRAWLDPIRALRLDGTATVDADRWSACACAVRKAVFPAAGLGTRFLPPPRRSPRKCCRSSTSRSSSTASRKRSRPASTTSSSSPAAARTRSRITSTSRSSSRRSSRRAASSEQLDEIRKISNLINFAVRAPGRAARPRPRRAGHARPGRRRTVRGHPRRRRDRRRAAGAEADDRRVRARCRARCSPSSACRATRSRATASSPPSRRSGHGVYRITRSGREAAARAKRRRTWRSSAATS